MILLSGAVMAKRLKLFKINGQLASAQLRSAAPKRL
jgi:hypothetical protein